MAKTNDRVSSIASYPSDDQISVRAYSDADLDFSEDCVSLATEPQSQAIKPQHQAIKPSHTATRPSHEANVSQPKRFNQTEWPTTILQDRYTSLTLLSHHGNLKRNCRLFVEKQFQRKLCYDQVCEILDNYNIPSVDCLITFKDPFANYMMLSHQELKFLQRKLKA